MTNANRLINHLKGCSPIPLGENDGIYSENMFTLERPEYSCGSPACVGGHIAVLEGNDPYDAEPETIANFLEIDDNEAKDIWHGNFRAWQTDDNELEEVIRHLTSMRDNQLNGTLTTYPEVQSTITAKRHPDTPND